MSYMQEPFLKIKSQTTNNVAEPECLYWILDPGRVADPEPFWPLDPESLFRIPDPKSINDNFLEFYNSL